jgi:hypothetical protein
MDDVQRQKKKETFLKALAVHGNVTSACKSARISRVAVYEWRDQDEVFKAAWEEALEGSNDVIRFAVFDRAVVGWEEPLVSMGKLVRDDAGQPMNVRKYSDSLLQFLAKSRMPEFREKQQIEHSGSIDTSGAKEMLLHKLQMLKDNAE